MSSRLSRPEDHVEIVPISWRQAGPPVDARAPQIASGAASDVRIAELERQVESRAQAAYQQGLAAGEAAATQRANQRMEPALATFSGMLQELAGARPRIR